MTDKYPSLKSMCTKCKKRNACTGLCAFAERYINQDGAVYEVETNDIIMLAHDGLTRNGTSLFQTSLEAEDSDHGIEALFSTDNETPFAHFNPEHTNTKIFIHRFFKGWKFSDIGSKFEITEGMARKIYDRACQRLKDGVNIIDERKKINHNAIRALERSTAIQLPQRQKYYILFTIFKCTTPEIADMFKISKDTVKQGIKVVSDQLKSGELNFTDIAYPEQWEAKKRLDARRQLKQNRGAAA
jgi:predicted DNA-binding protein YlxM (UPF0122 family)